MNQRYFSPVLQSMPDRSPQATHLSKVENKIYDRIWRLILEGSLAPSMKLPENIIGETFGVSRTVVRKVLLLLCRDGFVDLPANRGAYVATPSLEETLQVYEATRLLADHIISGLSARGLTDKQYQALIRHAEATREAEQAEDFVACRVLPGEFLILLGRFYGNLIIADSLEGLVMRTRIGAALYQIPSYRPPLESFQMRLIDVIRAKDSDAALSLFGDAFDRLERSLRNKSQDSKVDFKSLLAE